MSLTHEQILEGRRELPRWRIKKGVRPYGGRIFHGEQKGRIVELYVTGTSAGHSMAQSDRRQYRIDEVELVEEKKKP